MEDKVLDMIIIVETVYNMLSKLQKQCQNHCLLGRCVNCTCSRTFEELEKHMHEVQVNFKKMFCTSVLKTRLNLYVIIILLQLRVT